MAVGSPSSASRIAVERLRARMPGVAPDTVEIIELTRGHPYVVVRMLPEGLLVLDERGRLVRGRERLVVIGRHLLAVSKVRAHAGDARLDRRRAHVNESIVLLEGQRRFIPRVAVRRGINTVSVALEQLGDRLEAVAAALEGQRTLPPTERTLKRTIGLLNEAAGADRTVVRATRELAWELSRLTTIPRGAMPLRRWLIARLASTDIPYFYWELEEEQTARDVEEFLLSARAYGV
jgi:hypothetical protein